MNLTTSEIAEVVCAFERAAGWTRETSDWQEMRRTSITKKHSTKLKSLRCRWNSEIESKPSKAITKYLEGSSAKEIRGVCRGICRAWRGGRNPVYSKKEGVAETRLTRAGGYVAEYIDLWPFGN